MDIGEHVSLHASESIPVNNTESKSEYPEDSFRGVRHQDPVYGTLDVTERDTSL